MGSRETSRASGEITVFFGELPLELALVKGASEESVSFNLFNKETGNPIGLQKIDKILGTPVPAEGICKGKKIGDKVWLFDDAEIDAFKRKRLKEIKEICVETAQEIPAEYVKTAYFAKPKNEEIYNLVANGLLNGGMQVRFLVVEGNNEREAVLQVARDGTLRLVVKYYESEVLAPVKTQIKPVSEEYKVAMSQLLTNLHAEVKPENTKQRLFDEIITAKVMGKPAPIVVQSEAKVVKIDELLQKSILLAKAKR